MAYFDAVNANLAIRQRINGLLVGTAGSQMAARAITPGNILTDAVAGAGGVTNETKAVTFPQVYLTPTITRHQEAPPLNSNVALYTYAVKITLTYNLPSGAENEADREGFRATAQRDLDRIAQALGTPNSLLTTLAGDATGIISGLLYQTGAHTIASEDGTGAMVAEVTFTGAVFVAPALT